MPKIRPENPRSKESRSYNEEKMYHFHRQKGHDTNKCRTLKNIIQDSIENGKLEVDNHVAIPNQNLGFTKTHFHNI